MIYTVTAPNSEWLGKSETSTLIEAIGRKAAWAINQGAEAIILDADGYIVSTRLSLALPRDKG